MSNSGKPISVYLLSLEWAISGEAGVMGGSEIGGWRKKFEEEKTDQRYEDGKVADTDSAIKWLTFCSWLLN